MSRRHGGPRPGAGRPPLAEPTDAAGVVEWLARRKAPIRATDEGGRVVLEVAEAVKLLRLAGMGR
jgi:hypothetical protein